jgi:hypothetical protein
MSESDIIRQKGHPFRVKVFIELIEKGGIFIFIELVTSKTIKTSKLSYI